MPRVGRKNFNTSFFHVIVQGINKEYIFNSEKLMKKYQTLMFSTLQKYEVKLPAYCIMNNHAHMLIYAEKTEDMSRYMQSINTAFSKYYNKQENRVGVVFRNRYESEPIISRRYLFNCLAYIHNNPVKAKMVKHPSQYQYSSYNSYIEGTIDDDILELIFETKTDYLETFRFIHENNEEPYFKDYIKDVDYISKINELSNVNIGEIIMNEKILEEVIKDLIINYKMPINKICEIFKLTRYRIAKILKK